jgi:excisionase family DNA binding protein
LTGAGQTFPINVYFCAGAVPLERFAMRFYSIDQWCELKSFSRSYFYKLASQGKAPKTMKVGRSVRISEAADEQWTSALAGANCPICDNPSETLKEWRAARQAESAVAS